jgi:hypothetical protein
MSLPELTKCSTCSDYLLQEEIEFILQTKPYCKSCVDGDKELSAKSLHASRLMITGMLYDLTKEQQEEVYQELKRLHPEFEKKYSDLFFHETCLQIVDNDTKEVIHTVPRT